MQPGTDNQKNSHVWTEVQYIESSTKIIQLIYDSFPLEKEIGLGESPPPSTPSAAGQIPAATAAEDPPDEPPETLSMLWGLRVALQKEMFHAK